MSWQRFAPKQWTKSHMKLFKALVRVQIPFRSETKVAGFNVDFELPRNLIVEVDGESHKRESRRRKDAWKDCVLRKNGYKVLRFTDEQIGENVADCVAEIVYKLLEN